MSHKKKTTIFSECSRCGGIILQRDEAKHGELCDGQAHAESQIPFVLPRCLLRCASQQVADVSTDIPESFIGWQEAALILMNAHTLRALDVLPRHPCLVTTSNGRQFIGLLWPSQQVSPLRIWHCEILKEEMVTVRPILDIHRPPLINLTFETATRVDQHFQYFIRAYLRGAFLINEQSFEVYYCGRSFMLKTKATVTLRETLEEASARLRLEDDQLQVLEVTPSCYIEVTNPYPEISEMTLADIPGMKEAKDLLRKYIIQPSTGEIKSCKVLLYGLPGSGKSFLLRGVHAELKGRMVLLNSWQKLQEKINLLSIPSSIVGLDFKTLPPETESAAFEAVMQLLESEATVIISVNSPEDVVNSLRVKIIDEIDVGLPNELEREEILRFLVKELAEDEAKKIARETHAFTAGDLSRMAKRSTRLEGSSPLEKLEAVIWPLTRSALFERFSEPPPNGILLYGPPGCSKTLIAKALANESKRNFFSVKGPELFSKWVGDSEKAIRDLFAAARQVAPSLVFFDEIDAIAKSRVGSSSSDGVGDRVLTMLLTELDGFESNEGVLFLAATNRPDLIDSALLRPGRLDSLIYVRLPTASTRKAILSSRLSNKPISDSVSIPALVEQTAGFSGAEVAALCKEAAMAAMLEGDRAGETLDVQERHFTQAFREVQPITDRNLLDQNEGECTQEEGEAEQNCRQYGMASKDPDYIAFG